MASKVETGGKRNKMEKGVKKDETMLLKRNCSGFIDTKDAKFLQVAECSQEELIDRYQKAREAHEDLLIRSEYACESESKELEEPRYSEDEFVYVKRNIHEFMTSRLLALEKANYKLSDELDKCVSCLERVSSKLRSERINRAVTILDNLVAKRDLKMIGRYFYKLRLAPIVAKLEAHNEQEQQRQTATLKKQQQQQQQREQPRPHRKSVCERDTEGAHDTQEKLIAHLRGENRRLQLELEDRSRAAELLCKRLLRVDASARSISNF